MEILAMDGSLFHFFLFEVVIRSHGKICPRLYRINEEDVNFMKRSAKCRPVQSAVSKQSLRVSKSLSLFPLSRLYHNVDFLFFFAIFLFFEIIRIVVASYLNLISYFFSTTVNDAAPSVPLRFSPSYRSKINLIPQFRLLVHARCVNATTMLVEMYILFETRDPPLYCCYLSM